MAKGKPRTSSAAVEARRDVLAALQAGRALSEQEARELVDRLQRADRHDGWSEGYDQGHCDVTYSAD